MKSNNPVLVRDMEYISGTGATVEGVAWKVLLYFLFVVISANGSWNNFDVFAPYGIAIAFGAFAVGLAASFLPDFCLLFGPLYAVLEGFLIGVCSFHMEQAYPGIVLQAVSCTFGVGLSAAFFYANGLIKVSSGFKKAVYIMTTGIAVVYLADFVAAVFFGMRVPLLHENSMSGIFVSLLVICVATANLFVDFERVKQAADKGVDKCFEDYLAFGMTVTLIWLYLEILRLLVKSRSRK